MMRTVAVALLVASVAGPAGAAAVDRASSDEALVYTVSFDDVVHPVSAGYFKDALRKANDDRAGLLILLLNTPGGLMTSTEEMVTAITSSEVPVVVFVNGSKAASAGFFLTIAADVAVMAPGTRFGAAHPVAGMGTDIPKESPMNDKIENDAAAWVRSLANNRGRNAKAAEDAVRKSSAFTEQEALKLGLIDFICHNEADILKTLDGRTIKRFDGSRQTLALSRVRIVSLDMSGRERFLSMLANPALAGLLLFIGLIGLYVEFTHPGLIAPGLIGGICLLLFAMSIQMLPLNWAGVGLIVVGVVMFVLEINVPSYGLLTLGGIGCLILGGVMLFRDVPGLPAMGTARWMIVGVAAAAGIIMAILTALVARSLKRKVTTGEQGLVGEEGEALTDLGPAGRVFIHGEYWNARAAFPIARGARVRVTAVRDLVVDVEKVP